MSDSVQPHRRQTIRLHRPWDSPGKNTGVGCHFLVQVKPATQALPVKLCYIIYKRWETTLSIKAGEKKVFSFSCQDPHNYFVIEIQKNIGKYSLMDSLASLSLLSKLTQPPLLERWDLFWNSALSLACMWPVTVLSVLHGFRFVFSFNPQSSPKRSSQRKSLA